ncbi:barstar family protein [Listeria newyorkensis]|uniref:Barstar family protein n=1 Tax=Listeria newyorkensis TaxID=1497681 RepID=A0A841YZH0_9LIST|nr:barstar family protein [Listeria newyorkensis]MBC1457957.1 barstar family protein [Listeria newyorkensis]
MNNSIYTTSDDNVNDLKKKWSRSDTYVVEIDGKSVGSWEDYITKIEKAFDFPTSCLDTVDGYLDWIRDLSWIGKESYKLVIHDYNYFLAKEPKLKASIMNDFKEIILPFWQDEVESTVIGGEPNSFDVYLVE